VLAGGALFAACGLFRLATLHQEPAYLRDYLPSMLLSGFGVGFVFPQLSSLVAQALPDNRRGVGGAALQAGRQLGGTFGVALTIALVGATTGGAQLVASYDRIWWLIAVTGIATSVLVLPTVSAARTPEDATVAAAFPVE
jgi:MFS family permease